MLTLLLALSVFGADAFAQKLSRSDTAVTTTIADNYTNSGGTLSNYGIRSDLRGGYKNGVDSVSSLIQGIGDWVLDTKSSSVRRVFFDFSNPAPGNDPSKPTPASGFYPSRSLAGCSSKGYKLQDLLPGSTIECFLNTSVIINGAEYSIRFNAANSSGSNDVSWSCTATSPTTGKCNAWRAQSDLSGGGGQRAARLLKLTRSGNKTITEDYGLYYFSFDISLTNP